MKRNVRACTLFSNVMTRKARSGEKPTRSSDVFSHFLLDLSFTGQTEFRYLYVRLQQNTKHNSKTYCLLQVRLSSDMYLYVRIQNNTKTTEYQTQYQNVLSFTGRAGVHVSITWLVSGLS